ncbi:MAG: DUF3179 domain-containing (seleno)protein [bacterium]|nr:DUF3179 domain-containing (seleno)protein [bacterium]
MSTIAKHITHSRDREYDLMKKMRSLFVLTLFLWSCGGANENPLTFDTTQLDRQAQPGGNFLNPDTFPIDQLEFGGDRDEFPALIDQAMVPRGNENTLYLQDHDLVLGVEINGDVRAYPHNIFWWHEIANDVVGGVPIIVTFCPLTGTGIAFDARDSDGSRIILGVSGLLFNNNLVMYDQRDGETLYPQMTGVAISGPRKGQQLKQIPVVETTWEHWQQRHSNTKIVSGLTDADPGGLYTLNPYKHDGVDNNRDLHDFIPFARTLGCQRRCGRKPACDHLGCRYANGRSLLPASCWQNTHLRHDWVQRRCFSLSA